jgi:predicted HicB family RNase H-like nuclease
MKNMMQYKGFMGSVHFSGEDDLFFGRIEGIHDLVSFEGSDVAGLKKAFQEAVEDYIEICKQKNKPVHKSYKGNFNVRISPDLHQKAIQTALAKGISLNQLVQQAIEHEVSV